MHTSRTYPNHWSGVGPSFAGRAFGQWITTTLCFFGLLGRIKRQVVPITTTYHDTLFISLVCREDKLSCSFRECSFNVSPLSQTQALLADFPRRRCQFELQVLNPTNETKSNLVIFSPTSTLVWAQKQGPMRPEVGRSSQFVSKSEKCLFHQGYDPQRKKRTSTCGWVWVFFRPEEATSANFSLSYA